MPQNSWSRAPNYARSIFKPLVTVRLANSQQQAVEELTITMDPASVMVQAIAVERVDVNCNTTDCNTTNAAVEQTTVEE